MTSAIGDHIVYSLASGTETLNLTESTISFDTVVNTPNADTFTTSSGVVTIQETGLYLIINHLAVDRGTTGSNRTSGESFLHINNTLVSGAYTDGYLRRSSASDEFSDCAYGIYELTANDTVEVRKLRVNGAGSDGRVLGNVTTYATANTALSIVRLDNDQPCCILEGASGDTVSLTSAATAFPTFTTQTRLDTGFSHTSGSGNITIADAGKYLVMYSNSWERTTDNATRTGVVDLLQLNGSAIGGTWDNNYIRGSQSGEQITRGNNSSATIIETTTSNALLRLVSFREDGAITCNRLPLKSRICIYKLNDDAVTGRAELTGTQNMASTTEVTFGYDNEIWADTGISFASNQFTCTNASNYLMLTAAHSDTGVTRNEPWEWFQVNGSKVNYGTGSGYNRNSGGMQMTSPTVGLMASVGAGQAVRVRNDSLASNGTANAVSGTPAFCILDLATLTAPVAPTFQPSWASQSNQIIGSC